MQTRDQTAAALVFDHVQALITNPEGENNRLVSAVSFLRSRDESHHRLLLDQLRLELDRTGPFPSGTVGGDRAGFHQFVIRASLPEYMAATRTVLRLLHWHRRIAETLIADEEEEA